MRRNKSRKELYSNICTTHMWRVLRDVHADKSISKKGMSIMNAFVIDIFERIALQASKLCRLSKASTLSSREIQTSARLLLPGELAKHAVREGTKAINRFSSGGASASSASKAAGIRFSVERLNRSLRKGKYASRVGVGAGVYMGAVLEYLCLEILDLAGNAARDNRKTRVVPSHIMLAVRNDEELNKLLGSVTIASGGAVFRFHAVFGPKKGTENRTLMDPSWE